MSKKFKLKCGCCENIREYTVFNLINNCYFKSLPSKIRVKCIKCDNKSVYEFKPIIVDRISVSSSMLISIFIVVNLMNKGIILQQGGVPALFIIKFNLYILIIDLPILYLMYVFNFMNLDSESFKLVETIKVEKVKEI